MSNETRSPDALISRRRALGAGLFLLAGAAVGLATSSAMAANVGGRSGGGTSGGGSSGGGSSGGGTSGGGAAGGGSAAGSGLGGSGPGSAGDVILPGTPGNCAAGVDCGSGPMHTRMLVTNRNQPTPPPPPPPPPPKRLSRRTPVHPASHCDRRREGFIDNSCREPN